MSGTTGTTMNASLTLRLQDRISAGLGLLKQRLDGIRASAERIGAMGALGSAFAVGAPIAAAARFDDQLRAIAITAGLSGQAAEAYITKLRMQFQKLALETAQSSEAVAAAAGAMIARAMSPDLIDKLLPITARVATAASADMTDLAKVVDAISKNLGVAPEQMERSLAMLVVSAKEGKVELRDMAREFPGLAARAQSFGLQGLEAVKTLSSALQVAATASSTPSEAATNLMNLFQNLTRPETIKNFKEMGISMDGLLKSADARGINRLEAVLQTVMDLTRGDPLKLGQLIGDQQAGLAIMPFLRDFGREYIRIRGVVNNSRLEVLTEDFLTRMNGAATKIAQVTEAVGQLAERFGRELFSRIALVLSPLTFLLALMERVDSMAPDLIGEIIRWSAAFLVLVTVLGTLVTVLPIVLAGFRAIGLLFRIVFFFVPLLVKGFAALGAVAGTIAAPIAAIIGIVALIAGAIWTVYSQWDRFAGYFEQFFWGWRVAAVNFVYMLDALFKGDLSAVLESFKLMWNGLAIAFGAVFDVLRQIMILWIDDSLAWVANKVQAVADAFKRVWTDVRDWFKSLWDGIRLPDLSTWSDRPSRISNAPVGARLGLGPGSVQGLVGPGAGDFVRAPGAPRERVDLYINVPPGVSADTRTPDHWTSRQQELIDAYRPGRGPASPVGRP